MGTATRSLLHTCPPLHANEGCLRVHMSFGNMQHRQCSTCAGCGQPSSAPCGCQAVMTHLRLNVVEHLPLRFDQHRHVLQTMKNIIKNPAAGVMTSSVKLYVQGAVYAQRSPQTPKLHTAARNAEVVLHTHTLDAMQQSCRLGSCHMTRWMPSDCSLGVDLKFHNPTNGGKGLHQEDLVQVQEALLQLLDRLMALLDLR